MSFLHAAVHFTTTLGPFAAVSKLDIAVLSCGLASEDASRVTHMGHVYLLVLPECENGRAAAGVHGPTIFLRDLLRLDLLNESKRVAKPLRSN